MATDLLTVGTAAANSADFNLAAGESATLFLTDADGGMVPPNATGYIQIKSAGGEYFTVAQLRLNRASTSLSGPGTFRVHREPSTVAFGVGRG